jgi:Tol biopolymer transport system component
MKSILLFLIILFNCAVFQRTNKITPSEFDYRKISENYFNSGGDKPFPLTVQRGNNLYNSVSKEGKYLFFSTDTNGNFDIYVRDLKTAVIAPVTEHPSSEYKPAISPDGKKLVYISERKDSLGDLVLVELDTEELIQDHLNGNKYQLKEIYLTDDSNSKNTFSDMDPTWSPDAKGIYFSSDRFSPGLLNIIYYEIKSKTFKQITTLGGSSPQISENGNHLVFISKRDNENGEIYLFDLREGKEERITRDSFLNTSPSLSPDGQEIFFTSTRRDTNKSGNIDTNDNSLIIRMNLQTREERILTSDSYSIFDTRYSNFNGGSIIFSAGLNNSINIYFIPINGQIPKKNSIQEQFNFATSLKRKESTISFFLALDAVKLFFKDDPLFPIIQSRVLDVKYEENSFLKNKFESDKNLYELKSYSNQPNWEFAEAIYLKNTNAGNNQILEYYNSLKYKNKSNSQTLASILYLLSDIYEYKNEIESQEKIFKILIQEYADFYREKEVQRKLAKIELQKNKKLIPERYFTLLDPTKIQIRELRKILTDIEQIYESDTKTQSSVLFFDEIIDSNQLKSKSKYLFELFLFLKAKKLNQERKFEQFIIG